LGNPPPVIGVGARIRELRLEAAMSQSQLAKDAGLGHKNSVSRIERSDTIPKKATLLKIAAALGKPVRELLSAPEAVGHPN
jgi:transcriptional regulator with XRE-family HTH domain